MPLVSVIVAAYNVERYIEKCIVSLINQTYQNLEIILIDDGSTDLSGEICDKYAKKDSRIRVIHQKNAGIAEVRNTGLSESVGKYLMYVDGDDYVAENFVDAAVNCAEKYMAEIVIFDFEEIEESTGRCDRWSMNIPRNQVIDARQLPSVLITTPCMWNKLYLRSFWVDMGLRYPSGRNYEDLTMTPKLLSKASKIIYLQSEPLYFYMVHSGSIMRSRNFEKSFRDRTAAIGDILHFLKKEGLFKTFKNEMEYLTFEHVYFVPVKEILMENVRSIYLELFREYILEKFPEAFKNPYIKKNLSKKDRVMLRLMIWRAYEIIVLLSKIRSRVDKYRFKILNKRY
jgi:glycosyltransferase involved in cell wall biosynthesis